jgi:hypothetical protein
MKKFILFISTLLLSLSANAATFDFIGYADHGLTDDNGTSYSEGSYSPFVAVEDGITLSVEAYQTFDDGKNWTKTYAYLDEHNAGLGECSIKTTSCGSEDNVAETEKLVFTFGQKVSLGETVFLNKDHKPYFTGELAFYIDGSFITNLSLSNILDLSAYTGSVFEFYNFTEKGWPIDDFYIGSMSVSSVPVPAAAFLFAPALLGLVGLRRKAVKA